MAPSTFIYLTIIIKLCSRFRVGINFIVARAGQYRDLPRFDAYNQVRSIVHEASVDDTNIRMLLVDKPFFLNEYVNIACLPSITWVPVWTQCYITGRANLFLNYQFQTQIKGICPDYVDDNDWSFCTKQTKATNFCMDSWSGALVCPDNKGTFYAVGTYFSDVANCDVSGGEKSPEKFETLVSARAREGESLRPSVILFFNIVYTIDQSNIVFSSLFEHVYMHLNYLFQASLTSSATPLPRFLRNILA
jgi:hypothetical protein